MSLVSWFFADWVDDISFTLPTGQGYENNANFAFAIVGGLACGGYVVWRRRKQA